MAELIDFLQVMTIWHWIAFAGILLVLELLTGFTTFLLWPAAAAFLVGLLNLFGFMGWQADFTVFAILTAILIWVGQVYIRPRMKGGDKQHLNDRSARMVGQVGEVTVDFRNGRGRVNLDDTRWGAVSVDDSDLTKGSKIIVERIDGVTVIVRSA
ncbi:MAG: NfeD family protein [Robiginitomaculum sp.]|nr:NfeD family protein [Robiginitomaculum sp.]